MANRRPANLSDKRGTATGAVGAPWRAPAPTPGVVPLTEVTARPLRWLWPGRIPLGKLTVLDGDPGLGKSTLMLDVAARISRGAELPDGSHSDVDGPASVILLCSEDGLADTVRPRLEAAGADLGRVVGITGVPAANGMRGVILPRDWLVLARAIAEARPRLIVIDPVMAYLDRGVNAYRDQDIRRALLPFTMMAERLGTAMVLVRHLTKAPEGNPLYRGGGSIGIIGVARSGLVAGADPDDPTGQRRVLAVAKGNLAVSVPALGYTLESSPGSGASRVAWQGPVAHTAAMLLAQGATAADSATRDALDEAAAFLQAFLAEGPQPAAGVLAAAERAGLAERTLRRAKGALGIVARKEGSGWWWAFPAKVADPT